MSSFLDVALKITIDRALRGTDLDILNDNNSLQSVECLQGR